MRLNTGVHVFSNNPINVNLVSELIKSNTILYQVTATYDIKFQGVDSRWRFLTEKERDEEYNKILNKLWEIVFQNSS